MTVVLSHQDNESSGPTKRPHQGPDSVNSSGSKSKPGHLPALSKYGSKKNILVNLTGGEDAASLTKSVRNLSQAKLVGPMHIPLANAEYNTTRPVHSNSKAHSRSQQLLPLHRQSGEKNSSQCFDPLNYTQRKTQVLTLNKLPEIANHSQGGHEHSHLLRSSSRNEHSVDRAMGASHNPSLVKHLVGDNLSVYKKQPTPRQMQYGPLPISLPKMSDFWRGRMPEPIAYGDSINFKT